MLFVVTSIRIHGSSLISRQYRRHKQFHDCVPARLQQGDTLDHGSGRSRMACVTFYCIAQLSCENDCGSCRKKKLGSFRLFQSFVPQSSNGDHACPESSPHSIDWRSEGSDRPPGESIPLTTLYDCIVCPGVQSLCRLPAVHRYMYEI